MGKFSKIGALIARTTLTIHPYNFLDVVVKGLSFVFIYIFIMFDISLLFKIEGFWG